jgi:hypothetical protein
MKKIPADADRIRPPIRAIRVQTTWALHGSHSETDIGELVGDEVAVEEARASD